MAIFGSTPMRLVMLVSCLGAAAAASIAIPAVAGTSGTALVVGIDDGHGDARNACSQAAHNVGAHLREQGVDARPLINPSGIELRSAIDGLAAGFEGEHVGDALVYVCAPAVADGSRLFIVPSGASDGGTDLLAQGVILQAFLNALAGTGGTVFADLRFAGQAAANEVLRVQGKGVPSGLHLALDLAGNGCEAPIGRRLASQQISVGQGWNAIAPAIAADHGPGCDVLLKPDAAPRTDVQAAAKVSADARPQPAVAPPDATAGPPAPPSAAAPALPAAPDQSSPPGHPQQTGATASPPSAAPKAPGSVKPPKLASAGPSAKSPDQPSGMQGKAGQPMPPTGGARVAAQQPVQPASDPRIARLQVALARRNLYHGPVNGVENAATQASVRLLQRSLHAPDTGVLTQAEVIWLLNE